uniref:Uncharacterized protein n=1 Tax=Chromera velia CCMP2878 TaxID=1169474 RepID=A0A0G4H8W9_9ALVE|eukprot:Cvel_25288.t1-p1 / transcript=Cvel_25288.t1 / gene=Cvel_25288 / organism=Chromera_velia_CCMP2878 / gene_product=hypothetical protein / transcript_product=hypothetical protein / location=Cvel_scaffold2841:22075-23421(-) / protein_length=449 / sequence_SO=supercontig / SO=protein_coding / is_pseudo=false
MKKQSQASGEGGGCPLRFLGLYVVSEDGQPWPAPITCRVEALGSYGEVIGHTSFKADLCMGAGGVAQGGGLSLSSSGVAASGSFVGSSTVGEGGGTGVKKKKKMFTRYGGIGMLPGEAAGRGEESVSRELKGQETEELEERQSPMHPSLTIDPDGHPGPSLFPLREGNPVTTITAAAVGGEERGVPGEELLLGPLSAAAKLCSQSERVPNSLEVTSSREDDCEGRWVERDRERGDVSVSRRDTRESELFSQRTCSGSSSSSSSSSSSASSSALPQPSSYSVSGENIRKCEGLCRERDSQEEERDQRTVEEEKELRGCDRLETVMEGEHEEERGRHGDVRGASSHLARGKGDAFEIATLLDSLGFCWRNGNVQSTQWDFDFGFGFAWMGLGSSEKEKEGGKKGGKGKGQDKSSSSKKLSFSSSSDSTGVDLKLRWYLKVKIPAKVRTLKG